MWTKADMCMYVYVCVWLGWSFLSHLVSITTWEYKTTALRERAPQSRQSLNTLTSHTNTLVQLWPWCCGSFCSVCKDVCSHMLWTARAGMWTVSAHRLQRSR